MKQTTAVTDTDNSVNVADSFESKAYKRSRVAYTAQSTFEYFISLLVTDAFLAKLLTNIGISDAFIGIISSFISFAFFFQLASIWLIDKMKNVKRTVMFFDCFSQFLYICMYCVPFLNMSVGVKTVIVSVAIVLAYFSKYLVASVLFKWANAYVQPHKRGRFSAIKEMTSLFTGIIFTLCVGYVVDYFEAANAIRIGFIFIIAVLLVLNVLNFISFMGIKNGDIKDTSQKVPFKEVLKNTLLNKNFKRVVIMLSVWNFAIHITTPFMGTFKTKDLLLSVGLVQVINAAANAMRIVFSIPIGKYSDKKSYSKGMELAYIIAVTAFAINMFTTSKTWWLIIGYTVLYNISVAGTNANNFNIIYSYVKSDYIAQAMAIKSCISGVIGFFGTLIGSAILSYIQNNSNMIFGIHVYAQQVLSAITLIIGICVIIYDRTVVEKQKIMVQ